MNIGISHIFKQFYMMVVLITEYQNFKFAFSQLANFGLNGYFILVVFSFYQVLNLLFILLSSILIANFSISAGEIRIQMQELTAQRIKDIIIGRAEEYIQKSSNGETA